MKKLRFIFIFIVFFPCNLTASIDSKIILKVENKIITNFHLKNKILSSLILNNQEVNQNNIDTLKKQIIDTLILIKLKELEIEKYKLEINEKDLALRMNNYLNKISSNNIPKIKEIFDNYGVDYDMFQNEVKTELLWQNLIYRIYSNKIIIDEQGLNLEIEELIKKKENIEEFRIYEIEILLNNDESDKEKILSIENNIKKFGFETAATKFSSSDSAKNRGDLGWLNAKSLSSEIYKKIKNLNIGDFTKPIIRTNTATFLLVKDKKIVKANQLDKSKLKSQLIGQKKKELFNLYSQSHLSKLKNTSLIEYK